MVRLLFALMAVVLLASTALGRAAARPPVIDMHVHSTTVKPEHLTRLTAMNVRYVFLAGLGLDLRSWAVTADPKRYLPALVFPCDRGRAPITGGACFTGATDVPDTAWLRAELHAGRVKGFGEMSPQYVGMSPADERLDLYWELAEEFDVPVGVHMGPGPPGVAYPSTPIPFKSPAFRMALGDPLILEDVLLRHRRLRLFVMHAGWPRLESMVALLYAHPSVYVDVAALQYQALVPRNAYIVISVAWWRPAFPSASCSGPTFPINSAWGSTRFSRQTS